MEVICIYLSTNVTTLRWKKVVMLSKIQKINDRLKKLHDLYNTNRKCSQDESNSIQNWNCWLQVMLLHVLLYNKQTPFSIIYHRHLTVATKWSTSHWTKQLIKCWILKSLALDGVQKLSHWLSIESILASNYWTAIQIFFLSERIWQ